MSRVLILIFVILFLSCCLFPKDSYSGDKVSASDDSEKQEVSVKLDGNGPDSGERSNLGSVKEIIYAEYPKSYIIPKGVCEMGVPVIEIKR